MDGKPYVHSATGGTCSSVSASLRISSVFGFWGERGGSYQRLQREIVKIKSLSGGKSGLGRGGVEAKKTFFSSDFGQASKKFRLEFTMVEVPSIGGMSRDDDPSSNTFGLLFSKKIRRSDGRYQGCAVAQISDFLPSFKFPRYPDCVVVPNRARCWKKDVWHCTCPAQLLSSTSCFIPARVE